MKNVPSDTLAFYLNALRNRAKLSVREFARAAGYANGSSIQRYLEDPSISVLNRTIAPKIANALYGRGNPPIGLADLAPIVNATLQGPDAITEAALAKQLGLPPPNRHPTNAEVEAAEAGKMPVVGSAHASYWMPASPSMDTPEDWLTIPFSNTSPLPGQYVLRIKGPSVNKIAEEGHFAICQLYGEGAHSVPDGKFVHVERERHGEFEWTVKRVKWGPKGMALWPHSNHDAHQEPLAFGSPGDRVTIKGIVIGWYKPA